MPEPETVTKYQGLYWKWQGSSPRESDEITVETLGEGFISLGLGF